MKIYFPLFIIVLTLFSCQHKKSSLKKPVSNKPNIVLIMADDMGFSDIGCYGSEIHTPNIDRLASQGIRFDCFHNASRCCPTRASLLTGLYPHQTGLGWMTRLDLGHPGYIGQLNKQCVTLGEVLQQAGYHTYISGKWHVNKDDECEPDSPKHNWPVHRGFDGFFGTLKGATDYFKPEYLFENDRRIQPDSHFYFTDAITYHACQFIKEQQKTKSPFFLYVAHVAPHWPLQAKKEDIAKYMTTYQSGWDSIRLKRFERMKALGVISPNTNLSKPQGDILNWQELSDKQKKDMAKRMAIYAAQIDALDQGVGKIIETLKLTGALDNTLIIFLSDNGASSLKVSRRSKKYEDLGSDKSFESYGISWANLSNTPLKYYKLYEHEGGTATPLIVYWGDKIKRKGRIIHQTGHVIDIMPTLIQVAGASYPKTYKGHRIKTFQGISLLPYFNSDSLTKRTLFFEHVANRAVIDGDWKLVSLAKHTFPYTTDWELYNLKEDRSETRNLAEKYPEIVKRLAEKWQTWAEQNQVLPLDGRDWNHKIADPKAVQTHL